MTVENPGQSITEIAEKIPAIRDLDGVRSAGPNAVGVGAGAVAGNNLHPGMGFQPCRHGLRVAVGQPVDGTVALQIDDDRAVALTTPPGPVVDADDAWRRHRRQGSRPDQAQQRVAAHRHGQASRQAGTSFAAGAEGDAPLGLREPDCPPHLRQGDGRQAFGEDAARTLESGAAEPANLKIELANPALPRQVAEATNVTSVNAARPTPIHRAGRRGSATASGDDDAVVGDGDRINDETGREQGQQRF